MEAKDFSSLKISLASPEEIKRWSYGEVTKPETINYRRLRPEKDGLFCEAIFGPTKDWQCYCGKYKNIRHRGVICDKCGVQVTRSSVRRERMGHIELAAPVAHVWYTRRVPSHLGLLLDVNRKNLDRVLYFAQYVITHVDEEAREKALKRLERERVEREQEVCSEIEDKIASLREEQAVELQRAEEAKAKLLAELDAALNEETESLVREAQAKQSLIEEQMDKPAKANIDLLGELVVKKGVKPKGEHISRIQQAVNDRLQSLQAQYKAEREKELAKLEQSQAMLATDFDTPIAELERECDEKQRKIGLSAERTYEELQWFQPVDFRRPPQFLTENRYRELKGRYGQIFQANMGAEAFQILLQRLDLTFLSKHLWQEMRSTRSKQKREKAVKRLRVVESLRGSGNKAEWMIMTVLPVIPPDLRPMVQLDGGRFATSDMNDLYRRVINRNKRLKHLLDLGAPDVIVRNEKRMLQEAVDSLIDNSQRGKALSRRGRRELKSLSDMLKGKKGRFRRNLLGKRVDYSGRSVIVIGPKLKLHECGLPKSMALELFRPFVISRLVQHNYASNVKGAKRIIERERSEVWEVLEEVIKERPVFLNRAPTLHRLGIQAFEPKLVEGEAIQIHPLVCSAFNADFDGDQMAVHVPLSDRAIRETRELMLSTRNLLKPADGSPIVGPSKDMVLGIYYLTMDPSVDIVTLRDRADEFRSMATLRDAKAKVGIAHRSNGYYFSQKEEIPGCIVYEDVLQEDDRRISKIVESAIDRTVRALLEGEVDCLLANGYEAQRYFAAHGLSEQLVISNLHERRSVADIEEAAMLYAIGQVQLNAPILLGNPYEESRSDSPPQITTVGRAIFNQILPDGQRYVQETLNKEKLQDLVARCYQEEGSERTTQVIDDIKNLGFHYATVSGTTIAIEDLTIPHQRDQILGSAQEAVDEASRDYRRGLLTEDERYQITIDQWSEAKNELQSVIGDAIHPYGPIAIMALSGSSKGGFGPITQMSGMRGLMADPSGRIIDLPIKSHFRSGLTPLEYFISTHGSRKGLTDTALRTADAGYLTRRLVDVAQDVIVNRWDCGTNESHVIRKSDDVAGQRLSERIVGRCSAEEILAPQDGSTIVARNELIDEEIAEKIVEAGVEEVPIRSPLTCSLMHGICALCYGRDLGRGEMVEIGAAVGIVAAQSIGEPGTQLTLRTFQTGGTAGAVDITSGLPRVEELFEARSRPKGEAIMAEIDGRVRLIREEGVRKVIIHDSRVRREEYPLKEGMQLLVEEGVSFREGTEVAGWRNDAARKLVALENQNKAIEEDAKLASDHIRKHLGEKAESSLRFPALDNLLIVRKGQRVGYKHVQKVQDALAEQRSMQSADDYAHLEQSAKETIDKIQKHFFPAEETIRVGKQKIVIKGNRIKVEHLDKIQAVLDASRLEWEDERVELEKARDAGEANQIIVASADGQAFVEDDKLILRYEEIDEREYALTSTAILANDIVDGGMVVAGQQLTEGSKNPHLVLRVQGREAAQMYLLTEMQKVYRSQGVIISDKHFEIIIRKMFSKVRILSSGDSTLLPGDVVERLRLLDINEKLVEKGLEPAQSTPLLLRVTQTALETDSFLSAASFQHTIKELAKAAVQGAEDRLCGLKENVIIGKLIPAGTGFHTYQDRELSGDLIADEDDLMEISTTEDDSVLVAEAEKSIDGDLEDLSQNEVAALRSLPDHSSDN